MSGPLNDTIQSSGGDRYLRTGPLRVHNGHLQSGITTIIGCRVCEQGLEGFMEEVRPAVEKPEMVKSDGVDEEGDPSLAPGGWDDPR